MRAEGGSLIKGGFSGAAISVILWLRDILLIRTLRFAGADDAAAQERVIDFAFGAIVALEIKLCLLFCLFGFVIGVMAAAAWSHLCRNKTSAGRLSWAPAAAATFLAHLLMLLGMVGRYPQLYADRWWLGGGVPAAIQRVVTHVVGPMIFDLLFVGLVSLLLLGTLFRLLKALEAYSWSRWNIAAVAAGLVPLVIMSGLSLRAPTSSSGSPPNVLILCLDSLRTDRMESADVMPFTASLIPKGWIHRYAFTPIARTYPSWVSLLTGTEPRRHGVRTMFPSRTIRRDIGPTFISVLRDAGYHTFVVSDFAGDIFHGFSAGFDTVDTPELNVDTLAKSTVFNSHDWALPFLRSRWVRGWLPVWRNQPSIADPGWLTQEALHHIRSARGRPFAGVVFFSTAHFPYTPPYPYYARSEESYRGPFLYHVPQNQAGRDLSEGDVKQVRVLYDAALSSVDDAVRGFVAQLAQEGLMESTLLIVTGDHGEELYDAPGIAGHGDFVDLATSQAVPILLLGPGVSGGKSSNRQVRLYDVGATVLDVVGVNSSDTHTGRFGDGLTLREETVERPICVETGIWFFPTLPAALRGERLEYPGVAGLLDVDAESRELVLRSDMERIVETAKQRGVILGNRIWWERLTPNGLDASLEELDGIAAGTDRVDLRNLFEQRCIDGDAKLRRFFDAVIYQND